MCHATGRRPVHREDLVSLEDASHLRLRAAGLEALGADTSLAAGLLRCSGPSRPIPNKGLNGYYGPVAVAHFLAITMCRRAMTCSYSQFYALQRRLGHFGHQDPALMAQGQALPTRRQLHLSDLRLLSQPYQHHP